MRDRIGGIILAVVPTVGGTAVTLMWHSLDPTIGYAILVVCALAIVAGIYLLVTSFRNGRTGIKTRGRNARIVRPTITGQDTGILDEGDNTEIKDANVS